MRKLSASGRFDKSFHFDATNFGLQFHVCGFSPELHPERFVDCRLFHEFLILRILFSELARDHLYCRRTTEREGRDARNQGPSSTDSLHDNTAQVTAVTPGPPLSCRVRSRASWLHPKLLDERTT